MKKIVSGISTMLFLTAGVAMGQNISQSEVPSVIVNDFKKAFPKATDIEWEMDGDSYNVEFETGRSADHEIWYSAAGKIIRHKEEISKKDLPKAVTEKIEKDYKAYRIGDLKRIATGSEIIYTLELNSITKDWEISIDPNGKILKKRAD